MMTPYPYPYTPYAPYAPLPPSPAEQERRTLRREGHFLGTGMLVLIAMELFLYSGVLMVLMLSGVISPADATDSQLGLGNTGYLLMYGAMYTVMMGLPLWFAALCFGVRRNPFGMHQKVRPATFAAAVAVGLSGCILANMLTNTWMQAWSLFGVNLKNVPIYTEKTVVSLLLNLVIFAVLPALLEEMVFRGFVLRGLQGLGDTAAVVLSALLFGLMHTNMLQLPFAFMLGLMMGYLVVKTGNIWVSVTIHLCNNALSVALDYVSQFVTEETATVISALCFGILGVFGLLVLLVLLARHSSLTTPTKTRQTALTPGERRRALVGSPCLIVAIVLFSILTLALTLMP